MYNQDELLSAAEDLADSLLSSPQIHGYRQAEERMKGNAEAVASMRRLREVQEQIGDYVSRNVPQVHFQHLMDESETLLEKLESMEEVREFLSAQQAVNELLQAVTARISAPLQDPQSTSSDDSPR